MSIDCGVIIIDKPVGFTSFDVIAKLRGILSTRKLGHAGSLDPLATGVLPVLIGRATKALELLPCEDKEYEAHFQLGLTTTTQDITGEVLSRCQPHVSEQDFMAVLPRFRGDIKQIPPMYSAVQKDGVRLYDLARKGVEVEREPRPVTIYDLNLLDYSPQTGAGKLQVRCSKGTYIRTLAADIGNVLGCGAALTGLRRTMAAGYTLAAAVTLDALQALKDDGRVDEAILPLESVFAAYPAVDVTPAQARRFCSGAGLFLNRLTLPQDIGDILRVKCGRQFLALGQIRPDIGEMRVLRLFAGGPEM